MQSEPDIVLTVQPTINRYPADDPRWRRDAQELRDALGREVELPRALESPGDKGVVEDGVTLVLALGSVKALRYAVEALRVWVGRDSGREVHVSYNGRQTSIKGYSADEVCQLLMSDQRATGTDDSTA